MRHKLSFMCLAALLTFSGIHAKGADPVTNIETTFHQGLARGDAATVLQQLHPALQELVDAPVLEAWANAFRDKLGGHLSTNRLATNRAQTLTGVEINIESEIVFEQGTAASSMRFFDGQLVAFNITSEQLGDWFQGPSRIDFYAERAEAFISAFLNEDGEQARSMMHEALKKLVVDGKLESMMRTIAGNGGSFQSATLRTHRMTLEKDNQVLTLLFDLECERANGECEIEFQFAGMQGHLISFDFH